MDEGVHCSTVLDVIVVMAEHSTKIERYPLNCQSCCKFCSGCEGTYVTLALMYACTGNTQREICSNFVDVCYITVFYYHLLFLI